MKVFNPAAMHQLLALFCDPSSPAYACLLVVAAKWVFVGIASLLRLVLGRPIRVILWLPGRLLVGLELGPPPPS